MLQAHMERRHAGELKDPDKSGQVLNNQEDFDHENSLSGCDEEKQQEDFVIKEEISVEEPTMTPESSNPTQCSQCHQLFGNANELQDHLRVSHQSTKCPICDLEFENQVRFRYHKVREQ